MMMCFIQNLLFLSLRSIRLNYFLKNPILFNNTEIVETELIKDIQTIILRQGYGVKLVLAPNGAGKKTAIQYVCQKLQKKNKISGALFLDFPGSRVVPSVWFREKFADRFGSLLKPYEFLSDILPKYNRKPFVFVFNGVSVNEEYRIFIKTLAEDSELCKKYMIFVLLTDPKEANTMWEWNGRTKIVLLNDIFGKSPNDYLWRN
jgi:hypothetical protein